MQEAFQESLKIEVGSILQDLKQLDDESDRKWRKRELDRLYNEYETSLGSALGTRNKLSAGKEAELINIRKVLDIQCFP